MTRRVQTPLAWRNLTHEWRRLLIALCGIGFAVVLMFMETGFENALFDSTIKVFEDLNADLVISSKAQYALLAGETFSRQRLYQARGCPGVEGAYPVYFELYRGVWKPPKSKGNPIRVLAFDPRDPVFEIRGVAEQRDALQMPRTALIDTKSKSKHNVPETLDELLVQHGAELSAQSIRLVGMFELGTDFISDGNLIMSSLNFARFFPNRAMGADPLSIVDVGVIHVEDGADVNAVKQRLRRILPGDVEVYTKREFIDHEIEFWSESSPIGFVFALGTMIGFLVGVIICYQIIYSELADHMAEFATLKAMGYRNRYFIVFVLRESFYLSVLSFVPGLLVSLALYEGLARNTGLLMILNLERAVLVFALTIAMCIVSGCLAMNKVLAADPADLF